MWTKGDTPLAKQNEDLSKKPYSQMRNKGNTPLAKQARICQQLHSQMWIKNADHMSEVGTPSGNSATNEFANSCCSRYALVEHIKYTRNYESATSHAPLRICNLSNVLTFLHIRKIYSYSWKVFRFFHEAISHEHWYFQSRFFSTIFFFLTKNRLGG